jgi:alpha-glucosidase (family GH31 glycosyl hydrolase)
MLWNAQRRDPIASSAVQWTLLLPLLLASSANAQNSVNLSGNGIAFTANADGTRYGFSEQGHTLVAPDLFAGILLAGSPVTLASPSSCVASPCMLHGVSAAGEKVTLTIDIQPHHASLTVTPLHEGLEVRFVTAGAAPAFGLADHAVEQKLFSTRENKQFDTDVSGFSDDAFQSGQGQTRLVSNFVIYPQQHFAELLIDPYRKIVHTSDAQIVQGVAHAHGPVKLQYFFGDPHQIYKAYLDARNASGYRVFMPKYQAFGVGWEAFGALGWNTNQQTVTESIDRYLREGYPLRWIVIGSGFWPASPDSMHETTSFGLWDHAKYPDPRGMVEHFRDEHLIAMLGLRITFITDGPYSAEGVTRGYFLKDAAGKPEAFRGGWPKSPYYLLDAHNAAALNWYMSLVAKWQAAGIAGWKEDFYGYGKYDLRDDKVDPTNNRLMEENQLVIERNGYLSSNGDLHRINDFNYNQDQDRGPVNSLALAYSGFPLVYPDIVGGTFGEDRFSTTRSPQMERYMQRNVQWASLHSSMGMGEPPWTFDAETAAIMLRAAKLHERIAPYLYMNARRFAVDGYPWTMTPLPIAFPDDPHVYGRENATTRGYEWMIGDAMLAAPLYGNDYATASTRDVYLPAGQWMDLDTGKIYAGGRTLEHFSLAAGKTPLFIGGSGVTLEQVAQKIYVCIYPTSRSGSVTMTLPDAKSSISIEVFRNGTGKPTSSIQVMDHSGHSVATVQQGFATAFLPRAGEAYRITYP